ncbi:MAG: hypothetical protein VX017_08405, partial [Pseudomonadota bacterium]|nr:hypothetical protein [Pseudomonadota bacterium]
IAAGPYPFAISRRDVLSLSAARIIFTTLMFRFRYNTRKAISRQAVNQSRTACRMAPDSSRMSLGAGILQAAATCDPMSFKAVPVKDLKPEIRASFAPGKRNFGMILAFWSNFLTH